MKIEELLIASPALNQLATRQMPVKMAYAIAKNIKAVNEELKTFDETRIKLLQENWSLNSDTNQYDIPPDEKVKWDEMYKELVNTEVDIKIYKVNLTTMDGFQLAPAEILVLSWMFEGID